MKKKLGRLINPILPPPLRTSPNRGDIEDVGVEGKRYPTNVLGRTLVRYPLCMFLTILLPVIFFIVGCVRIGEDINYTLSDFRLSTAVTVAADAQRYNRVTDQWADTLSGASRDSMVVDTEAERSLVRDVVELRIVVDPDLLTRYCVAQNVDFTKNCSAMGNILTYDNMLFVSSVEQEIMKSEHFTDVCFTNDLEYGRVNLLVPKPDCVPPTSLSQYVNPQYNASETLSYRLWHMNGLGSVVQQNYLPRLFVNPNYGWFFDANFSALNQKATQLRTGFVLASSPGQSDADYRRSAGGFVRAAQRYLEQSVKHRFLRVMMGGDLVQNSQIADVASAEGYKVAIAFVIAFVLSWWHSGSFFIGFYAAAQVIFTYMAAVGLYAVIYKSLPLMTYSAVVWVMTFGLHGTLSFYDMFVYTGVMATKGRQNNLSVPQRICFTIRRITVGVWIANILAIVIFAINTTSAFDSVRHFSVLMMIAFLWNMYFIVLPTPAMMCVQHLYFSDRRRDHQKQIDVINMKARECRRDSTGLTVLAVVQSNLTQGEKAYSLDTDVVAARIGANRGINKGYYKGFGDFLHKQISQGYSRARLVGEEAVGAAHKARKVRRKYCCGGGHEDENNYGGPSKVEMTQQTTTGDRRNGMYHNRRLVAHGDVIHVPADVAERSEECWARMCDAIKQRNPYGAQAPHVFTLRTTSETSRDLRAFTVRWTRAAEALELATNAPDSHSAPDLLPVMARTVVRAQDPSYVAGGRGGMVEDEAGAEGPEDSNLTTAVEPVAGSSGAQSSRRHVSPGSGGDGKRGPTDPGNAGFGLTKIRYRWRHRQDQPRSCCCGLCGDIVGETAEQRMERLMSRQIKAEGYTLFERFIIRAYVPCVVFFRWALLLLFIVLFIVVCVVGSFIKAAGIPVTLIQNDTSFSAGYAALDNTFGQRGTCVFCGPYYKPVDVYRTATREEVEVCNAQIPGPQMNVYPDKCGVCGGDNACMDCAGDPDGPHVEQCDSCELPGNPSCNCVNGRDCSYCAWELNISGKGGADCSVECTSTTCLNGGHCDQYTGKCVCPSKFAGERCEECAPWLLPIESNPRCSWECNSLTTSDACRCDTVQGTCTSCPAGTRGYNCDQPAMDCGAHGRYSTALSGCLCDSGWGGVDCRDSQRCNYRGPWLEANESPTGEAMCGCKGHWRGPTCQLCDCVNGGMCNDDGVCECQGPFMGSRCQTCAADCVRHGTCPTNIFYNLLNIRACIEERCSEEDKAAERACAACLEPTLESPACQIYTLESTCNLRGECWWNSAMGQCVGARADENISALLACTCDNPKVYSGNSCERCLAPQGAICEDDSTVLDCTGLVVDDASQALGTDACGVCGGDGLCRGCDGVPGSGLVYDMCGVCGGNGACIGVDQTPPMFADYLLSFSRDEDTVKSVNFADALVAVCRSIRDTAGVTASSPCVIESYLASLSTDHVESLQSLYNYANSTGRLAEVVFNINYAGRVTTWTAMTYRVQFVNLTSAYSPDTIFEVFMDMKRGVQDATQDALSAQGIALAVTSNDLTSATAVVLSRQSLWFAVGIGLAACFVALYAHFVSLLAAAGGTVVAGIVCFGSLTVCVMFPEWRLDAVLQVCISCTIPIGVEYVVHIMSGYFDYLQTTTSHLFARQATQRGALTGTLLRSVPSICTSVVAVILSSIAFDVSELIPSKRSGQVCITMHLVLLVAVFFFCGATAALGPRRSYQHWTLSVFLCLVCGVVACICVAIIAGVGGVVAPSGKRILDPKH